MLAVAPRKVRTVASKLLKRRPSTNELLLAAAFYYEYGRIFGYRMLAEAEYIFHDFPACGQTHEELLSYARELVEKYARASLVVTSRIHCALPCLGLETPVVLVEDSRQEEMSSCRFGGLRELFHVVTWDAGRLKMCFEHRGPLTGGNGLSN